jgi:hypothetical protein
MRDAHTSDVTHVDNGTDDNAKVVEITFWIADGLQVGQLHGSVMLVG